MVALNKVLDLVRMSKRECCMFKGDFKKAYDPVGWSFLDYLQVRFNFNGT